MTGMAHQVWLPLFTLFYVMVMLYWARISVRAAKGKDGFFSAGHSLAPWIAAVTIAGTSLTGWFVLGGSQIIAQTGLVLPALLTAGITVALPGVIFFKRSWFVAERLRVSSQAEIFRVYYQSPFLVVASTLVALLFALGFAGLQVRMLSQLAEVLTGGAVSALGASVIFGFVVFAGAGIGGMRSIGYFGVVQTVLAFVAIVTLAGFATLHAGSFQALNATLMDLYAADGNAGLFNVGKVILFNSGLGRGGDPATAHTAIANLSLAIALMGFQAGPLALKLVLSTRSPRGIAAGQTWVTAGALGALVVAGIALIGASGLAGEGGLSDLLSRMQAGSPWFAAWVFIGLAAAVQLLAGLSIFAAAEGIVRHVYRPYFHSALTKTQSISLTRIVIAVLAALAMVMQNVSPMTVSALAALALPVSFQLWTPMLGVTWMGWITKPAAVTGVGFGIAGVLLTEPAGYQLLSFFGLELPWGRWPWTIHSAVWGLAANLAAVLIISAITDRNALTDEAREIRKLFSDVLDGGPRVRALRSTAWCLVLVWFFLAAGPGLIWGNTAFVGQVDGAAVWLLGMPSLWAWSIGGWMTGFGLIWFLSYKMEMASPVHAEIPAYRPPLSLKKDQSVVEAERLRALVITGAAGFALAALIALSFG